jgi:hypothetical protein
VQRYQHLLRLQHVQTGTSLESLRTYGSDRALPCCIARTCPLHGGRSTVLDP